MPTYAYKCTHCDHSLEASQKMSDPVLTTCPECNQETLKRGPGGGVGLAFKGTGFYITDYTSIGKEEKSSGNSCCPCGKNECS